MKLTDPNANQRSSQQGSALLLALLTVMVVAGLGATFLLVAQSASRRQSAETENLQAFYLAEAGLAEAFQALRIGRSGQVGSEASPAVRGDGLLWVDATNTADDQVRLTSTALLGSGRASLALVVEPVEIPLGFFSDEDLVVDEVLLVDGFNSEEATYEEELIALGQNPNPLPYPDADPVTPPPVNPGPGTDPAPEFIPLVQEVKVGEDIFLFLPSGEIVIDEANETLEWRGVFYHYTELRTSEDHFFSDGYYLNDPNPDVAPTETDGVLTASPNLGGEYLTSSEYTVSDPSLSVSLLGPHTDSGGLLSSNGNVRFATPAGQPVSILGDVIPGPDGIVEGLSNIFVSGETEPRTLPVELPAVEVPSVALAAPVRHDGLLPMLVAPGTTGHERIEVAADAELILRGPATVVIDTLVLEPGALLTLDTRDGDVALYVTGGMDLQSGSVVVTTSDFPDELSIQVAAIPTGVGGAPVKLDATSQFHGTIYAPETDVRVGSDFEVYGGIVARRLELGAGARLHFDNAEYEGSPIPRLVSWRIVEVPSTVRTRLGDPYDVLGVTRGEPVALAEAHDLASVRLTITYIDQGGTERTFDSTEDQFDWNLVGEVLHIARDSTRIDEQQIDQQSDQQGDQQGDLQGTRVDVQAAIDGYPMTMNSSDLVNLLIPLSPLSPEEWTLVEAAGLAGGQYTRLLAAQ